jgi:hypothetical protein
MRIEHLGAASNGEIVDPGVDGIEAGNFLAALGDQNLHGQSLHPAVSI